MFSLILTVITKSLVNWGMCFVQCVMKLLVQTVLPEFWNIFCYKKFKITIWNRAIGYRIIQCVLGDPGLWLGETHKCGGITPVNGYVIIYNVYSFDIRLVVHCSPYVKYWRFLCIWLLFRFYFTPCTFSAWMHTFGVASFVFVRTFCLSLYNSYILT